MQKVFVIGVLLLGACGDGLSVPAAVSPATVSPATPGVDPPVPALASTTTTPDIESDVTVIAVPGIDDLDDVLSELDLMFGDFETSFNQYEGDITP
ncbi:MAG: hypothetical protein OEM97_10750 [Acidimicrobiia bacterium]|nr:hypothetical protein [Acidimicrobiia bacterium]